MLTYFWLLQDDFRERATGFATGTTVLALPRDAVLQHVIALPPTSIRAAAVCVLQPLLAKITAAVDESRVLAELRDTLLPKLISGELRIDGAEATLEATA